MAGLAKFMPYSSTLLQKAAAAPIAHADIKKKLVFFYFSASWCPPCRGFTPQLVEFYNKFHEKKNFEVVLVSWDEEKEAYQGYFDKMPWLALPFEDRKGMEFLTKGFNVESIPTLIGVEAETGKIVTTRARNMVVTDPEGEQFPWGDQRQSKP